VALTSGNSLKVRWSLQCGTRHILHHTTWCQSGGLFSLGREVIGWRQCETNSEMLREIVVVREVAWANNGILAGDYTALDTVETENDLVLKKRQRKGNCTEWPRSKTLWGCSSAAKTYVLHIRNLVHNIRKWQPYNTSRILMRWSKLPDNSFDMMVQLRFNCQKDHLCHRYCL